jgi:hypothetical protein
MERLSARKKLTLSEKELSGVIYERVGDQMSFARIRTGKCAAGRPPCTLNDSDMNTSD